MSTVSTVATSGCVILRNSVGPALLLHRPTLEVTRILVRVHKFVKKSCDLADALAAAVVDWRAGEHGQVDAERREQGGERGAERARGAVLRLQRDAEAVVVRRADEAFRAALRE